MGTTSSHHQEPMDRTTFHGSFKRSASLRFSKSKAGPRASQRKMDKIRSSFRDSFRRKKDPTPEISKQQQWQIDSSDVRTGTCCFHVKYLGCIEVFESRGMTVCEEALKVLRGSRRRPVKAILYISGDGLRVVEDDTKGLIVDQTIDKVSFCAPDRNHERGFSYICRDGTTRRWLCHGFLALNESGERLSHAVGCAFSLCLERKQTREKENVAAAAAVTAITTIVTNTINSLSSLSTTTTASTVVTTTNISTNTLSTVNAVVGAASIPANIVASYGKVNPNVKKENIPVKRTTPVTIHSVERPHATFSMLQRQGSFRGLSHLNQASPFKRQLSLKISDLPSNLERTTRLRNLVRPTESPLLSSGTAADNSISNAFIAKVDAVSLQNNSDVNSVLFTNSGFSADASIVSNNFPLYSVNNRSVDDVRAGAGISLKRSASFTPPATPPPMFAANELPHPEQWLGKLSEITSNISELTANITELASSTETTTDNLPVLSSSDVVKSAVQTTTTTAASNRKSQLIAYHGRAYSLGSGENAYNINNDDTAVSVNHPVIKSTNDPFDAEWATPQVTQPSVVSGGRSTNPFLTSTVTTSDVRLIE